MLSDIPLVLSPGKLDETYAWSSILAYLVHYMKTQCHPQNRKVDNVLHCNQRRTEPQLQVTCIENRKFSEIWTCSFWYIQTDRQTNKQTDIQTLHTPTQKKNNFLELFKRCHSNMAHVNMQCSPITSEIITAATFDGTVTPLNCNLQQC